jgi:hypothetical protein
MEVFKRLEAIMERMKVKILIKAREDKMTDIM